MATHFRVTPEAEFDYVRVSTYALCRNTQARLDVRVELHSATIGTASNSVSCTTTQICFVDMDVWIYRGNCIHAIGTFAASPGSPSSGADWSGPHCRL